MIIIPLIIGSLFTISIQYVAQKYSNANLIGNELQEHLQKQLYNKLNTNNDNLKIELISSGKVEALNNSDIIIACGMFRSKNFFNISDYTGRYIAIFEKDHKKFINYVFNTETAFKIVYLLQFEEKRYE